MNPIKLAVIISWLTLMAALSVVAQDSSSLPYDQKMDVVY